MQRIALHALTLENFRNYTSLRLEAEGQSVVLVGANGAGKTNILEAISLLIPGRGLRRAKIAELDHHHQQPAKPWVVAARLHGLQGEVVVGTGRLAAVDTESERRLIKIDGCEVKSQHDLSEHAAVLWLTPQMDQMWSEGDSAKRRFLDRLAYAFDPAHAGRVSAYEYAMRDRNRLLQDSRADPHWLDALEQKMAESATAITLARLQTVESLSHVMHESSLSFPKAALTLSGFLEDELKRGETALMAEKSYAAQLLHDRKIDAASGRTQAGVHKSRLTIGYASRNMDAEFCSTGEQKALLLSLVLAHARACAKWKSLTPVLLLDEVVAHLDGKRRRELFDELNDLGAQVWMTGTDVELFEGMRHAPRYRVEQAQLQRLNGES